MDNFISPPPSAAGITEHFSTIISSGINTEKNLDLEPVKVCYGLIAIILWRK
jgi:hypothetical protein